jgi:hypothetical protein
MTSCGPEMRNMGAAMAGKERSVIKGALVLMVSFWFLKIDINFME